MSKLRRTAIAAILAVVALAITASPALASPAAPQHKPMPVGSIAGGLGIAAIAGICLLAVQLRRRRTNSTKR